MTNTGGNPFIPRALRRIDDQIQSCISATERNLLFAKKSIALAKHGYIEEAKAINLKLRDINDKYDPRLTAWIMFSEGIAEHSETLNNEKSKDKFIRSHLISQVAKDCELAGTSAAWVAHCAFVAGRTKEAASHLDKAFQLSDQDNNEARGRACMVLANGFNMAAESELSNHWYKLARTHAVNEGDIAMQNIMLYNATAFHVSQLTLTDCQSCLEPALLRRVVLEVASAYNLNSALGIRNLPSTISGMQAEMLVMTGDWADAEEMLSQTLPKLEGEGQAHLLPKMFAQRAWCRAKMGHSVDAISDMNNSCTIAEKCVDYDDLAILHFRLSGVGRVLGDSEIEQHHHSIATSYLKKFEEQQEEILELFSPVANRANEQ